MYTRYSKDSVQDLPDRPGFAKIVFSPGLLANIDLNYGEACPHCGRRDEDMPDWTNYNGAIVRIIERGINYVMVDTFNAEWPT